MAPIRVALVDDEALVLAGVAAIVARASDVEVVGTAADLPSAISLVEESRPDVVLADIQLRGQSGLALLDHFPPGQPPIILLSAHDHPAYYQAAVQRGAAGYVMKSAVVEELVDAIRRVATGEVAFPVHALRRRGDSVRPPSRRELEVVQLVAEGSSNDEIAARLAISTKTVDSHLRAMFDRYRVVSRTDLAMRAVAEGWLRRVGSPHVDGVRWMIDESVVSGRAAERR